MNQNDAESAAMLGLVKASDDFKPDLGVPFEAYATIKIMGEMRNEMSKEFRHKHETLEGVQKSYDDEGAIILSVDIENLSKFMNGDILARWIKGETMEDIGKDIGLTKSGVSRRIKKATKAAADHILKKGGADS